MRLYCSASWWRGAGQIIRYSGTNGQIIGDGTDTTRGSRTQWNNSYVEKHADDQGRMSVVSGELPSHAGVAPKDRGRTRPGG